MARSAENLGFSLPLLCEMAKIGLNFPLFGERNKKIPRFLDFLGNFFWGPGLFSSQLPKIAVSFPPGVQNGGGYQKLVENK